MPDLMEGVPGGAFRDRRARVFEALGRGAMVLPGARVQFSSRDSALPFRADSELYYLTGVAEPDAVAVLRGHADEGRFVLFVRPRDEKAELWNGPRLGPEGARSRFAPDAVHPLDDLEGALPELLDGADAVHYRLGASPRADPLVRRALETARARGARKGTGPRAVVDPGGILDELRLVKDAWELERMRRAGSISADAHRELMARARPGMGEWEMEAILTAAFRRAGAEGPAYETIVASGGNACVLHYVANDRVAEDGDLVLVDAGASWRLYASDITRTFPVGGRFTDAQRDVYAAVDRARAAGVAAVRPGATVDDVHRATAGVLVEELVSLGVLDGDPGELLEEEAHLDVYPHRTSHWLGLDTHDPGDYARDGRSRTLEPGMVLTVEPGLYFRPDTEGPGAPFAGIGVRVEDDVAVTEEGGEVLTGGVPTAAEEVEALVGSEAG